VRRRWPAELIWRCRKQQSVPWRVTYSDSSAASSYSWTSPPS